MPDDDPLPLPRAPNQRQGIQNATKRGRSAAHEAMAVFVVDLRKRSPTMKYADVIAEVRKKFGVSKATAERVLTSAQDIIRADFQKFCADAPMTIFDAYMQLHQEATLERNWEVARRTLDSVRDMFGMRGAINVNVNHTAMPVDAFAQLSDDQLDALASLDQLAAANGQRIIDVPTVEASVELAGIAMDVIQHEDGDG